MLKKFILTVALICTICVGVIAATALWSPAIVCAADDSAHTHPVCGATHTDIGNHTGQCANVTFTAWDGTTVIPYDSNKTAYVYLSKNVELEQLDILAGYTLYLCLNGFSISSKRNGTDFKDTTIYVNGKAKLVLCDCKGSGKITHNTGLLGNGVYVGDNNYGNSGTFIMYGGEISGNTTGSSSKPVDGAGVTVQNGAFYMYGGNISNNLCKYVSANGYGGGGVLLYSGVTSCIYGGEISGNSSSLDGGGIFAIGCDLKIYGGKISGNKAGADGGGLCVYNTTPVISNNVEISGNSALRGGGIYAARQSFTLSGNVKISNNKADADGGGIYSYSQDLYILDNVEISGNTAADNGGGIYFKGNSFNMSGNFTVSGNTKNGNANNIYLPSNCYVTIKGELTGDGKIGITTATKPQTNGYVQISSSTSNKTYLNPDKFEYENTTDAEICTAKNGSYLVACVHKYGTEYAYDENSHWHGCSLCDKKKDEAAHTVVTDEAKAATCTETGLTTGSHCSVCNTVLVKQETVKANGHDLVHHEAKAATCTEIGWEAYDTCKNCDYTTYKEIQAEGHVWKTDWTIDVPATCTADGSKSHHCLRCDDKTDVTAIPATGHTEITDAEVAATCTTTGRTVGKHCSVCNEVLIKQDIIPALGHSWNNGEVTTKPDCVNKGVKTYSCTRDGCTSIKIEDVDALGHDEVTDAAVASTCTTTGRTVGKHCSVCNEVLTPQTVIPAKGHTKVKDNAVPATCTEAGKTEGYHCSVCYEVFVAQSVIVAKGHDTCIDEAVEATCTQTGLTEGNHCSVCNTILTAQKVIPALGHDKKHHEAKAATCTEVGWNAYETCTRCDYTTYSELKAKGHAWETEWTVDVHETCTADGSKSHHCLRCDDKTDVTAIPAKGHTVVVDAAVAATCTTTGKTEGRYCSTCDEVLTKQEIIPSFGHSWNEGTITTEPDCVNKGVKTYSCTRDGCGATKIAVIEANGHTEITDAAVASTCTTTGRTVGKHCSVCNEVLIKQDIIPALGHSWNNGEVTTEPDCVNKGVKTYSCTRDGCNSIKTEDVDALGHDEVTDDAIPATCTTIGKTEGKHCSACNEILIQQDIIPSLGHEWNNGEVTTKPDCVNKGVKTYNCTRDDCTSIKIEDVDALGHDEVTDAAVEATCTTIGKTEGKHCSVCNEVLTAQTVIPALGHDHSLEWTIDAPATCTADGSKSHHCLRCGDKADVTVIPATGHTEVVDPAVPATCTEAGKTEGKHCSVCNAVLVEQTETSALGHVYDDDYDATCNVCGHERTDVKIAPKILEGNDGKWNTGDSGELAFTTNVSSSKFVGITVDGVNIDESKFERQNDGTKIVLKPEFLASLSVGKHTLSVISKDGTVETNFTVEERAAVSPQVPAVNEKSDTFKAWWLLIIPAVAMIAVIGTIVIKNKKQDRKEK